MLCASVKLRWFENGPDPPSLNFFLSCAFTCHCPNGGRASPLLSGRASPLQHCMWASLTQKRKRTISAVTGIVLLPTSRPSSTARTCRRTFLHNRHQCRGLRPCFTSTGWRADGGGPRLCRTICWNCMCRSRAKSLTLWHCRCKYYPVCLCMPLLRLLLTPKVPIFPRSQPILQGDHLLLGGPQLLLQIFILLPRYPIAPIGISPCSNLSNFGHTTAFSCCPSSGFPAPLSPLRVLPLHRFLR